ncbi:MAG TPA: DUF1707 domain-containing protein [Gaiellaceae bacterium]|nr:DUF1707 domain-containing protein [Gaiellaceae bacterium]
MALVGDRERDLATRQLRRHYAEGRLDERELSERLGLVLGARSRWQIAYALRGLPLLGEVAARVRHALLVAVVGMVWLMLSAAIVVAFLVWVAAHGATLAALVAFLTVWLVVSALLYRRTTVSRRRLPRP